jgi:hypothetical protein
MSKYYFHNLCVAFDQLANTLLAGYPDETLSSRSYRCKDKLRWRIAMHVINGLFCDKNHCSKAFRLEVDLPEEYGNSWDSKYK